MSTLLQVSVILLLSTVLHACAGIDDALPVISILGENPTTLEVLTEYSDLGATAYDEVDGDLSNAITTEYAVDNSGLGTYLVRYTVSDSNGNISMASRTVLVVDTTPPAITILGDNPLPVEPFADYREPGATAVDAYDGDLTQLLSIESAVEPSVSGIYSVSYSVSDSSGNATSILRTVEVRETTVRIVTPLTSYPIAGYAEGADQVTVNGQAVELDASSGFRVDVTLQEGTNVFLIEVYRDGELNESYELEIVLDQTTSLESRPLLYSIGRSPPETVVIDALGKYILGVIPGVEIVTAAPDGKHAIDSEGYIYQSSDLTPTGGRLPVTSTPVYPLFSWDSEVVYAGTQKFRFSDQLLLSESLPISVDNRFARVVEDDFLIQGNWGSFATIDLMTCMEVEETGIDPQRLLGRASYPNPNGALGIVTSYSFGREAIDHVDLETGNILFQSSDLSDYMGSVAFRRDGKYAFVGSYGNSYFGGGGVYVIDLDAMTIRSFYAVFGGASVTMGPDAQLYVTARYADHFGDGSVTRGNKYRRGVAVLELDDAGELHCTKSFFLNNVHAYQTLTALFYNEAD